MSIGEGLFLAWLIGFMVWWWELGFVALLWFLVIPIGAFVDWRESRRRGL